MKKLLYTLGIFLLLLSNFSAKAADDDNDDNNNDDNKVKYCLVKLEYNDEDKGEGKATYCFLDISLNEEDIKEIIKKEYNALFDECNTLQQGDKLLKASSFDEEVFEEGILNDLEDFSIDVLFSEKEVKSLISELLKGNADDLYSDLFDIQEDNKVVFTRRGNDVVAETLKGYVKEKTDDTGGNNGDTSQQNQDQLVDPNETEPIEIKTEGDNEDNKFEENKDNSSDLNEESIFLRMKNGVYLIFVLITIIISIASFIMFRRYSKTKRRKRR